MRPTIAAIVPVLDEIDRIEEVLTGVAHQPGIDELIVVDGGSVDGTAEGAARTLAETAGDGTQGPRTQWLTASRGRARQMNAGAAVAAADVLLFLHADTALPQDAAAHIATAVGRGHVWGRFDVRLSGGSPMFRVVERAMNLRSVLSGVATGDQAIFVRRDVFRLLGGFAPIPLMEDIELCSRLKWIGHPARIRTAVTASSRRWERGGIARTILRMWALRLAFAAGVAPARLARWYR